MNEQVTLSLQTALIAGLLCPPIVSFLKQTKWSVSTKHAVSFLISGVAGAVGLFVDHQLNKPMTFNLQWLLAVIGQVHAVSQVVYHLYFSGSQLDTKLTSMLQPADTTVTPPPSPPTK